MQGREGGRERKRGEGRDKVGNVQGREGGRKRKREGIREGMCKGGREGGTEGRKVDCRKRVDVRTVDAVYTFHGRRERN